MGGGGGEMGGELGLLQVGEVRVYVRDFVSMKMYLCVLDCYYMYIAVPNSKCSVNHSRP